MTTDTAAVWPKKTREIQNHHLDSTVWNEFAFRHDDIVIATWPKSGSTWVQQIVGQLVFAGQKDISVAKISPWLDFCGIPKAKRLASIEAQQHRRFIKTHLPVDALVFSPNAKYVFVGRDGRDVLWSLYNHHSNTSDISYRLMKGAPDRVGPPIDKAHSDIRAYFHEWLDRDGFPYWSFWSQIESWWNVRTIPNVLLVHFDNLKTNLDGEARRIAAFLDIDVGEEQWPQIIEHCTFGYMKKNAPTIVPAAEWAFKGGARTFINQGTNGRWRDVLTEEDNSKYEMHARRNLAKECAHWLAHGKMQ